MSIQNKNFIYDNSKLIPDEVIGRLRKLSSSLLSDAMNSFGTMDSSIKSMVPGTKMVGTAITVELKPGDNLFLHKSIYLSKAGYVLVVSCKEHIAGASWGEMMTRGAIAMGAEGVVLDGAIRDLKELEELRFPVFAKTVIPNGVSTSELGIINRDISCGGVSVKPGDLIFGDDDGVVVVPIEDIDKVIEFAENKLQNEKDRIQEIKEGEIMPEWIDKRIDQVLKR